MSAFAIQLRTVHYFAIFDWITQWKSIILYYDNGIVYMYIETANSNSFEWRLSSFRWV